MKRWLFLLVAVVVTPLLVGGCDEGTPVVPPEGILTISANPQSIGLFGESVITVTAQRATGQPVSPGTEIFLTTNLGAIPDDVVETDERGIAKTLFEGRGESGTATVQAVSGGATAEMEIAIEEEGEEIESLSLTANPGALPHTGGTATLRAPARDGQGDPISGVSVVFATEAGSLASGGSIVRTEADGTAADTLTLGEPEAEGLAGSSFEVSAEAVHAGTTVTATATIHVEAADGG